MKPVYAVDIDGTICEELPSEKYNGMTKEDYAKLKKIRHKVKLLRRIKRLGYEIYYYTARSWTLFQVTKEWLEKKGFPKGVLICGKMFYFRLLDDKMVGFKELTDEYIYQDAKEYMEKFKERE